MPTADSFTALGRGNGFPFCATKVDVSGFDNWITLSGVSSGSASRSQINESLVNAIKLWWNLNSITGSFSASTTDSEENNLSVSATGHELIIKRYGESDALTPVRRACVGTSSSTFFNKEQLQSRFAEEDENDGASGFVQGNLNVGHNPFIVRMYNGSTDDEDNFVGYGVSELASVGGYASAFNIFGSGGITVASFINGTDDSGVDPDTGIAFDLKVFQTTLGGIPFRSKSLANATGNSGQSVSASQFSVSATASASFGDPVERSSSANVSTSLSSIDFYTY